LSVQNRSWGGTISGSGQIYDCGTSVPPRSTDDTTIVRLLPSGLADFSWASGGAAITPVSSSQEDQAQAPARRERPAGSDR